jgi:TrmH family RNA methyltransferase
MTKNEIKFIRSLQQKKNRQAHSLFVVEGAKNVLEVLKSNWKVKSLFVTPEFEEEMNDFLKTEYIDIRPIVSKQASLQQAGTFKTNNSALAVIKIPEQNLDAIFENDSGLVLALDSIKDPGNLGTIIRTADWYGITQIVCSPDCVDSFNPKVIAASMGSFLRVKTSYLKLEDFFEKNTLPVYGAFLEGENVHQLNFETKAILLIGSESHGIGASLSEFVTKKVHIPRFGQAESLNAGIATAIICDNWKRNEK